MHVCEEGSEVTSMAAKAKQDWLPVWGGSALHISSPPQLFACSLEVEIPRCCYSRRVYSSDPTIHLYTAKVNPETKTQDDGFLAVGNLLR